MQGYYKGKLEGERLRQCYELAHPRVSQYLEAEIQFVLQHLERTETVLELGCGYGRVTARLAEIAERVVGIDNATESIELSRRLFGTGSRCVFFEMDALELSFHNSEFDTVVCIQNGISAFGVDKETLIRQAMRVTRPGGQLFFSTYSDRFWNERLKWFETQAEAGLVGEIDYDRTGNGNIICMDGFQAGQVTRDEFESLCVRLSLNAEITEVDESIVFCKIMVPEIA